MRAILWMTTVLAASGGGETPAGDFDNQIVPVLTKAGCNAGACHGAAVGRGGFRLSLYGGDPDADYRSIVHELEGRRVNLARPEESLVLLKPTESIDHGGGYRLEYDGPGAEMLLDWVRQGAARRQGKRLSRLRVAPSPHVADSVGATVTLSATATYSDGSTDDVTRWTVFAPDDPAAVEVDPESAEIKLLRKGRHVVVARFLDQVVPIEILVPVADRSADLSSEPARGFIDRHVLERLEMLHLPASPPADDAAFLRRVTLDLTGRLPSLDLCREYPDDPNPDKREALIDALMRSEEFDQYWTLWFAKLLRIRAQPKDAAGAETYHGWLRKRIEDRTPYDRLARELLLADGDTHEVGPANFYRTASGPREQAELTSELFMGNRLRCANCHNHPLDRWTQDDYHGLAAIFARLTQGRVIEVSPRGEVIHPRTGEPAAARIPGGRFLDGTGGGRAALADWLTAPDNPYFAEAIVNRLWKAMMGRGLVEPTDDLRATNPPTHPALLDRLARDFVRHGYDWRHTLRTIASSATYGRSVMPRPGSGADDRFYSHALMRPLPPEVLADAISDVTGVDDRYGDRPLGTRAVMLVDPGVDSRSLDILGRCSREDSCETRDGAADGLTRALHLLNGPLLNRRISDPDGRLARMAAEGRPPEEIVERFYLRALGRLPGEQEREYWRTRLATAGSPDKRQAVLEDFLWGLLSCREFVNNH